MRELTVRIKFVKHCLGNVRDHGRMVFPRTPDGYVMFMPSWHHQSLRVAADLLGRHQDAVQKIHFDVAVDSPPCRDNWHKRYYRGEQPNRNAKKVRGALYDARDQQLFMWHECFPPGHIVGINCLVPAEITDDDLLQLFNIAGRYRGISPWKPGDFGHFVVDKITARRGPQPPEVLKETVLPMTGQTPLK